MQQDISKLIECAHELMDRIERDLNFIIKSVEVKKAEGHGPIIL